MSPHRATGSESLHPHPVVQFLSRKQGTQLVVRTTCVQIRELLSIMVIAKHTGTQELEMEFQGCQPLGPRAALLVQAGLAGSLARPSWALTYVGLGCLWASVSLVPYLARPGWFSWQSWVPGGIVQGDSVASGTFWQPEMMARES